MSILDTIKTGLAVKAGELQSMGELQFMGELRSWESLGGRRLFRHRSKCDAADLIHGVTGDRLCSQAAGPPVHNACVYAIVGTGQATNMMEMKMAGISAITFAPLVTVPEPSIPIGVLSGLLAICRRRRP